MSKRGYISRYMLIVKKLKAKPYSTFDEVRNYIEHNLEFLQMQDEELSIGLSLRTFQRDLRDIRNIFGLDIEYSRTDRGYYISQDETDNMNFQRMIESFDLFSTLNSARDLQPYIHLEKQRPQGTENMHGLLQAIKNRQGISFRYQKFWDDTTRQRIAEPYVLKEFRNRWYVIAKDIEDSAIKSFALDRLTALEITGRSFTYPKDFDAEKMYRHCFGIISPNDEHPAEVILSFNPHQGKYIKSLPLHETQEILKDTREELQIKLNVFITRDFVMELLSHGDTVKVIKPDSLIREVNKTYQRSLQLYGQTC
jgi:predicted DNA-binding transcriptional regulator YafY